jgi:SAM-dependent methyltransferase
VKIFQKYANYYNLLYRDKDYPGEVEFINKLLQKYRPGIKSILDMGCGSGAHASLLARKGYEVHGIDISRDMLDQAGQTRSLLPEETASRLSFSHGDIRDIRIEKKFDAVVALFHVISYQPTDEDLSAAFQTVKHHLKPGGIFIFDCWYGPAVLSDPPVVRIKRFEDEEILITRIAEPVIHTDTNCVDVNYQVFVSDKSTGSIEEFEETHQMRYLFQPEMEDLMADSGLRGIECGEWMTGRDPGLDSWNVYFVAEGT